MDLRTTFVGVEMCSPIIVASAGITEKADLMRQAQENGAGGVVMKSLFQEEISRRSPTPRFHIIRHDLRDRETFSLYSYEQASEWGLERYAEEVRQATEELDLLVIPSINCYTLEGWAEYARAMEEAGARAIELNTSCPHGSITFAGHEVEKTIFESVQAAREGTSLPLIVKLSPMLTAPGNVAKGVQELGVQGVTIFNRMTGIEVDIETERPVMHGGYAGHGGPWAIQYPLRWISQLSGELELDIAGSGGVSAWEDVVKYLLCGARAVQTCTAVVMNGFGVIGELLDGLKGWMERHGYERIEDFRGKACGQIVGTQDVDRERRVWAQVEREIIPPCEAACPVGTPVQGYALLIAEGKYREALELAKQRNPFPAICGRVCHHPCEAECSRNEIDDPLAIAALKRFVADLELRLPMQTEAAERTRGERVAIVGGGPAGLTAAKELAQLGYGVTIVEALPELGGMMVAGIPSFRLPRDVVREEIQAITDLGVEVRTDTRLGRDVTIEDLRAEGHQAILLAIGAHASVKLNVSGEELPHVLPGVKFLQQVNLGQAPKLSGKVVVVGGGDVAFDSARTAVRLGAERVTIIYRRSAAEMPANLEEREQAAEEGVAIRYLCAPVDIREGVVRCVEMELGEPDESGRRRPLPIEGSEFEIEADWVIAAIGQEPDLDFAAERPRLVTERGRIAADEGFATAEEGVFAAGDALTGPESLIEAIAAGYRAARAIHHHLSGEWLPDIPRRPVLEDKREKIADDTVLTRRQRPKLRPAEERAKDFEEASLGYSETLAKAEAARCLTCVPCAACGQCTRICIYHAIAMEDGRPVISLDCDGCGLCTYLCPNEAIRMEPRPQEEADRDEARV